MRFNTSRPGRFVARPNGRGGTLFDIGKSHDGLAPDHPYLWLHLADQAFAAGRYEQVEALIAEVYANFTLDFFEEEPGCDLE
jgi:hypothetical protein